MKRRTLLHLPIGFVQQWTDELQIGYMVKTVTKFYGKQRLVTALNRAYNCVTNPGYTFTTSFLTAFNNNFTRIYC
jgi:hypothetical protein